MPRSVIPGEISCECPIAILDEERDIEREKRLYIERYERRWVGRGREGNRETESVRGYTAAHAPKQHDTKSIQNGKRSPRKQRQRLKQINYSI